jgi:hypothetical protein
MKNCVSLKNSGSAEEIVMRVAPLSYMSADAAWWETVYSIEDCLRALSVRHE